MKEISPANARCHIENGKISIFPLKQRGWKNQTLVMIVDKDLEAVAWVPSVCTTSKLTGHCILTQVYMVKGSKIT